MRKILFRGKRIDNGEWVEGHLIQYEEWGARICESHTEIFCYEKDRSIIQTVAHEVGLSTVGQFTGLKDKNGKRIFEGDICKIGNLIYKVEFRYSEWVFTILSKKVYCCPAFHSHCGEYCEVIGNIHGNPELLEAPNA